MTAVPGLRQVARVARAHLLRSRRRTDAWAWRRLSKGLRRPYEVVDRFDTWAYLDELRRTLSAQLSAHGIEHLLLDDNGSRTRVAIRAIDADRFLRTLARSADTARWWAAPSRRGLIGRARPVGRQRVGSADGVLISRRLLSSAGVALTHSELGVLVEFWRAAEAPTPRSGGGLLAVGTLLAPFSNAVLDYLDADQWTRAQSAGHRLPQPAPHLLTVTEPVDLVYTWVDGADPAWLARKVAALGRPAGNRYSGDAALAVRFTSRDELRYSLRSVAMFAGWVRKIWLVTDQQVPPWLKPDARLTVVDHREIFADPDALPVFNSHAIESQLHHIDGLAEHYLYLNDDMLFGAPVRPEHFFHGNGVSKVFTSRVAVIDPAPTDYDDLAVMAAAKNNRALLEREFGRTITHKLWHTPQPHSRSMMEEFERGHPGLFDSVMRSRFRSVTDHSLTSALDAYYAVASGRAAPGRLRYGYLDLGAPDMWMTLEGWLRKRSLHCFCLNDATSNDPARRAAEEAALREFFESYYPVRSPWE